MTPEKVGSLPGQVVDCYKNKVPGVLLRKIP